MDELQALEKLQRIARSETLDALIEDGLAAKQKQAKLLQEQCHHLKKLRKRKAKVVMALAGMTQDKLDDMQNALQARERKRQQRSQGISAESNGKGKKRGRAAAKSEAKSTGATRSDHPKAGDLTDDEPTTSPMIPQDPVRAERVRADEAERKRMYK